MKTNDKEMFTCKRCGEKHRPRQCPAYGKTCAKCKGQNHNARICLFEKKGQGVQTVQEDTDDSDDFCETFFIKMVSHDEDDRAQSSKVSNTGQTVNTVTDDKWTAPLLVNGTIVTFKIDTGAKANLISENDLKALTEKPRRFAEKGTPLKAYNNQPIKTKGGCRLKVTAKSKQHNLLFIIVPYGHESFLGDKASEDLGLVKRIYQINTDKMVKQGKRL